MTINSPSAFGAEEMVKAQSKVIDAGKSKGKVSPNWRAYRSFRMIFNSIDDCVCILDARNNLIDFNESFRTAFSKNYEVKPRVGDNVLNFLREILDTESLEVWMKNYNSALRGKQGKYIHRFLANGKFRFHEVTHYPLLDGFAVHGATIIFRDITESKMTEISLLDEHTLIDKIHFELDRLLYSTSHDLRGPLLSIRGLIHLAKMDANRGELRNYIDMIETSVDKLDHYVRSISDYSYNSKVSIKNEKIDFVDILSRAIKSLNHLQRIGSVQIMHKVTGTSAFYSDPRRLSIIFYNLISNAIQFSGPTDKPYLTIDIVIEPDNAKLIFEDNGMGIDSEKTTEVFQMFNRGSDRSQGPGLGLFLVKETISRLNGKLTLNSNIGLGTTIVIVIPNLFQLQLNEIF